jgi:hypothetical protein
MRYAENWACGLLAARKSCTGELFDTCKATMELGEV